MAAAAELISGYMHPEERQVRLKQTERKQLWQWVSELAVTLLALAAFVLLSFPGFTQQTDPLYRVEPRYAFPGLLSLLLLFNTVSIQKHWLLRKERNELLWPQVQTADAASPVADSPAAAGMDSATELPNGPAAEEWLSKEMTAARARKKPLTLLFLRLDGFDKMYRSGGNALCEKTLQAAGERMRSAVRGSDLAAHFGDGEFVLALPGCSLSEAQHVLNRVGGVAIHSGAQDLSLEFSSASVDSQAGECSAEFIQRGRKLLHLYADAGQASDLQIPA